MQANPRRNPKSFAQRTMAAAIAASAIATAGIVHAQTTGGGIGANVNSNAGASGLPTQGTTGTTGGTNSGVAAPNAQANPLRPGTGPGINNTGSPVLSTPKSLRGPIGGGSGRTSAGTSQIPGNTIPPPPQTTRGLNGANVPQPTTTPRATGTPATTPGLAAPPAPTAGTTGGRVGANLRTGAITNFTDTSISFREGANTSTLKVTPNTVVQMDGRNITLRDIPANSQVRIERNARFPSVVQRIVVVPPAVGSSTGGTSVNTQTGTGSTGSANRSLQNDINAPTGNSTTPGGDINAATPNATTPGGDINAPVVNQADTSNRPLAPGQNPADRPVAPFTRGADGRLQAGFNEPATQQNTNQQQTAPVTDSSQFLGPVTGGKAKSSSTVNDAPSPDTGKNAPGITPSDGATPVPTNPLTGRPERPPLEWFNTFSTRFGGQLNSSNDGLTVESLTNQSFAARSGLRAGDRIQSINGTPVSSPENFARSLQTASVAQTPISARIFRGGEFRDVSLTLPNGFFDGVTIPVATAGAATVGVTPAGTAGTNVLVPATGDTQVGTAGTVQGAAAAAAAANPAAQSTIQERTQTRGRPLDPPVGTQRAGVTTEALKIPDVDLGWTLKATPEGVVMSTLVEDGLAAKNKFETGDIVEAIDGRPVNSPGAVSYELHRHRAGATVDFTILRNGKRVTEPVTLPASHKPLLLNRNETFGQANNSAKEQGASGVRPAQVTPTEESIRTLEAENKALRAELEELRRSKQP